MKKMKSFDLCLYRFYKPLCNHNQKLVQNQTQTLNLQQWTLLEAHFLQHLQERLVGAQEVR